jgi:hypothetical protein
MRCPRCAIESPGPYCPNCGLPVAWGQAVVTCPQCGTQHSMWNCPVCGFPTPVLLSPPSPRRAYADALSVLWQLGMILMFLIFAICLVALVYSCLVLIFPALQAGQLISWPMLTIFPQLAVVFWIDGAVAVTVYFIVILVALLLIHCWFALSDGKNVVRLLSAPLTFLLPRLRSKNRWTMVAQLFLAVQFFQFVYVLLVSLSGVPITGPPGEPTEPWLLLFSLAEAPVYEEIVSRVALIGLPMFLGSIVFRTARLYGGGTPVSWDEKKQRSYFLGSFKYLWGGTVDRKSPRLVFASSFVLAILSSIFFSAAHSNYGAWKLLPTFIAGLALAYAYLRGGLLASILLHFTVNMFSGAAVLVQDDMSILILIALVTWAVMAVGSGFFVYYCIYFVNIVRERLGRQTPIARVESPPPTYPPSPSFAAICPYCGWSESLYAEGKLRCANCGRER